MKKQARLLCYIEQHVFDLPPLVNMKARRKLQLRWSHFSLKIIRIELISQMDIINNNLFNAHPGV